MEVITAKPFDKAAIESQVVALQNNVLEISMKLGQLADREADLKEQLAKARGALDLAVHVRDNFAWPEPPAAPGENPPAVGEKS